jgi:hypothetical protein
MAEFIDPVVVGKKTRHSFSMIKNQCFVFFSKIAVVNSTEAMEATAGRSEKEM